MSATLPKVAVVLPPREGFGPSRAGAIGLLVHRLRQATGFETIIIGGKQDGPTFLESSRFAGASSSARFHPVTPSRWSIGSTNLRYAAAVAHVLKQLDPTLIEVHNRPEIALALAKRLPNVPVTAFLHNDPIGMRQATTPAERTLLLRRLAGVVTPSEYLRQRVLDGVATPDKDPFVLPNCLDLAEMPPRRPRERLILFTGRVVADKGPDAFVAACAAALPHLPGWTAAIIGADRFSLDSPDTAYVRTIRAAAETAHIRMLGYRNHPDVLEAMSRAAIVVVPSRWAEPFGLVALEALASGAALICAPRGGLPEVAGSAALYADPDHLNEIAAAIQSLAENEPARAALAEAGRQRAQKFDVPIIAARLAALRRVIIG